MPYCNRVWTPNYDLTTANLPWGANTYKVMAVLDANGSGPVFSAEEFKAALLTPNPLKYPTEFSFERGLLVRFGRPSRNCEHLDPRCRCPAFWMDPLKGL